MTHSSNGGLRALLGYERVLGAEVVGAFVEELCLSLRRKAKRFLALRSVANVHAAAVAAIQRTDGAMRLNEHEHVLALDGVYMRDGPEGTLAFHALPGPARGGDRGRIGKASGDRRSRRVEVERGLPQA